MKILISELPKDAVFSMQEKILKKIENQKNVVQCLHIGNLEHYQAVPLHYEQVVPINDQFVDYYRPKR